MSDDLKEGYFVRIPILGASKYWKITTREPFNYRTGDATTAEFTTVTTGNSSGDKLISVLDPDITPHRRLYQVWYGVKDGLKYYMKIPSGTTRFGLDEDRDTGYISNVNSPWLSKNKMYEMWLIHEYYPSANAYNYTQHTVTPKLYFSGWKYDIEPASGVDVGLIESGRIPVKTLTIGGVIP